MHARLLATKSLLTLYRIKLDSPYLADEIAEPRPDMNIKVAAFILSEKSSNTLWSYSVNIGFVDILYLPQV